MKDFKQKTVLGLKWNLVNRLFSQFLTLIIGILLARLLSPEEFGIIGMVAVFTGFAGILVDFGFTSAIIQNKESDTRHWSSVFWLNLAISFAIAVLFTVLSPLIANFFNQPLLRDVTIVVAWRIFLQSFGLVQLSLLKKALKFKEIAKIELISHIFAGIVAIAAAYNGYSYWSLVIQLYVSGIIRGVLLWIGSRWTPSFIVDSSAIKEMFNFSLPLIGMQTTHYWTHNIDSLIIGKVLGDTALGIYGRAYTLMLVPLQSVSRVISSVMFPAYSLIQNDPERIRRIYLSINRIIGLITFPMMFGLIVTAEPFVRVVLGDQWMGVVPVIQILAPIGVWRSIHSLIGNIFMAKGETNLLFRITLPSSFLVAGFMLAGVYIDGLVGLAVAYCCGSIITGLALDYFLSKLINLSVLDNLKNVFPVAFAALVMATLVFLVDIYFAESLANVLRLCLLILAGVVVYGVTLRLLGLHKDISAVIKQVK